MKKLILPLALSIICCGCSGGFKNTSSTSSPSNTQTNSPAALAVTTSALPIAVKNVQYSETLTAQGGTAPYTWTVSSGQLPTGFTLSSAGVLSGVSSAPGDFNFTVQVTDSAPSPSTARVRARAKKAVN